MKRILCLALILISIFAIAACSRQEGEAPLGMKNASSKTADFYLYVPDDWTVNTDENDLMASARASESDPSNITMIGFEDGRSKYDSIDSFWAYYKGEFETRIFDKIIDSENGESKTSFNLTNDGEDIIIGKNYAAKKYEYSGKVAGSDFSYMQVIIKRDSIFYIFTYTSTPDLYSVHKEEVGFMIDYMEFK